MTITMSALLFLLAIQTPKAVIPTALTPTETVQIQSTKVDDHTIEIIQQKTTAATTVVQYDVDALVKQRADIQAQKDREIALRDAELAEVDRLLAECAKLGIVPTGKP